MLKHRNSGKVTSNSPDSIVENEPNLLPDDGCDSFSLNSQTEMLEIVRFYFFLFLFLFFRSL